MSLNLEQLIWMPSPSLVPEDSAIDVQHLGRMTLGEAALEAEVLALFSAQSGELMTRLKIVPPEAPALAHTLKGSARAIGAFRVAEAALGVEAAIKTEGDVAGAIVLLQQAVEEAQETIGRMLNRS
jgi:HPt (histidine-containing phosphotransfer) domain-containing protein